MVFPHEHILLRFNGHFGSSSSRLDRWSCGIRFGFPNLAPIFDTGKLQTFVTAADAAARTMHATSAMAAGTNTFFDFVSGAQIGVSGRYTPSSQQTILSPDVPLAGVGAPSQPWNAALVISLRTAIPRGRGSNGRVYWPGLALVPLAATGRVQQSVVDTRLTTFKTFVESLNSAANAYSTGMRAVVASNVGGGLITAVTAIRSDERLDSIERRENGQPANWTTKPIN